MDSQKKKSKVKTKTHENVRLKKQFKLPKVGDKIYVGSAYYCSHGSDDFDGGLCEIDLVEVDKNLPKDNCNRVMVRVKERPGILSNYSYLLENQKEWKKEFGKRRGKMNPDEDMPWIEDGDLVDGKVYHGPDIW